MTVPNRPAGSDVRSISQILADFDDVEALAGAWRDIMYGAIASNRGTFNSGDNILGLDSAPFATGSNNNTLSWAKWLDPADWQVGTGTRNVRFRLRSWYQTNAVGPGVIFTPKLYKGTPTSYQPSGTSDLENWVSGGSGAAFTPAAGTGPVAQEGAVFSLTAGLCAVGVNLSGVLAAGSKIDFGVILQVHTE